MFTDNAPPPNNSNDLVSGSVNGNRSIGIVIGARQSNVGVVLNGSGPITVNTNRDSEGQGAQTTLGSNNGSNNGNNNGNGGGLNNGNGNGVNNAGSVVEPIEEDPGYIAPPRNGNEVDSSPNTNGPVVTLPASALTNNNPTISGVRPNNGNNNGNNNYGFDADIDGVGDGLVNVGSSLVRNWNQFWGWGGNGSGSSNGNYNGNGNGQNNGNHNGNANVG